MHVWVVALLVEHINCLFVIEGVCREAKRERYIVRNMFFLCVAMRFVKYASESFAV